MAKTILLILMVFISLTVNSQSGEQDTEMPKKEYRDIIFSPGLIVQHETFLEFNVLLGDVTALQSSKIPIVGVDGFRIGFESNLRDGRDHTIAPKIGYEISVTVFSLRLSAVNYFQNGNSEFRALPELGISIYGWANLMYGYGIPFNNGNLNNVSCHRVSLSFNLDRRLKDAVFEDW